MKVGGCEKMHKLLVFLFLQMLVQLIGINCSPEGTTFFGGHVTNKMQSLLQKAEQI